MLGRIKTCGALTAALAGALIVGGITSGALAADPYGIWLNEPQDAHVKLYSCNGDELCGQIVWLKRPLGKDGKPRRDVKNDDESLRDRPVLGIQMLFDLEDQGGGQWEDGEVYNARDGGTYDAELEVVDANTVKVSGCVWFVCKTETWTRVE